MSPARMAELERELFEAAREESDAYVRARLLAASNQMARAAFGRPLAVLRVDPPARMPWEEGPPTS